MRERERDPNRLSRPAWKFFVRLADNPAEQIEERCLALHWIRDEEIAARKECDRKGYIRQAGTLGHNTAFFELTPKGVEFAQKHNVPIRRFKSGVVHEYLLAQVRTELLRACPDIRWVDPAGATARIRVARRRAVEKKGRSPAALRHDAEGGVGHFGAAGDAHIVVGPKQLLDGIDGDASTFAPIALRRE